MSSNLREIGKGGYSVVYAKNGEAIKVTNFNENYRAILHELRVLSFTNHPNVIKLTSFQPGEEFKFYLELADYSLEGKQFSGVTLKVITYELVRGLAYLHSNQIIHGDIKPGNLLSIKDRIVYSDFGISSFGECGGISNIAYTFLYQAPEVLSGKPYSFSADIWALGITILELYFGKNIIREYFNTLDDSMVPEGVSASDYGMNQMKIIMVNEFGVNENIFEDFIPEKYNGSLYGLESVEDSNLRDLLKMMLNPVESERKANNLLSHPYFLGLPDEDYPFLCEQPVPERNIVIPVPKITQKYRTTLFYWLIEVSSKIRENIETLFLCFNLFDLVENNYNVSQYQLVIGSCLLISSGLIRLEDRMIDLDFLLDHILSLVATNRQIWNMIYEIIGKVGNKSYLSTPYDYLVDKNDKATNIALLLIITNKNCRKYDQEDLAKLAVYMGKGEGILSSELRSFLNEIKKDFTIPKTELDYYSPNRKFDVSKLRWT